MNSSSELSGPEKFITDVLSVLIVTLLLPLIAGIPLAELTVDSINEYVKNPTEENYKLLSTNLNECLDEPTSQVAMPCENKLKRMMDKRKLVFESVVLLMLTHNQLDLIKKHDLLNDGRGFGIGPRTYEYLAEYHGDDHYVLLQKGKVVMAINNVIALQGNLGVMPALSN